MPRSHELPLSARLLPFLICISWSTLGTGKIESLVPAFSFLMAALGNVGLGSENFGIWKNGGKNRGKGKGRKTKIKARATSNFQSKFHSEIVHILS